jgi:transcriptional regulator with XRE-family HTH domain
MGAAARIKPKHLARKLRRIRLALGLSQSDMLRRLGYEGVIAYYRISNYELGTGEPPLPVLLEYARLAGVSTDVLIDDKVKLPANIPAKPKRS